MPIKANEQSTHARTHARKQFKLSETYIIVEKFLVATLY